MISPRVNTLFSFELRIEASKGKPRRRKLKSQFRTERSTKLGA